MAIELDPIRAAADRVAGRLGLDIVEIDLVGGGRNRVLRILIEKDEAGRAALRELAAKGEGDLPSGVPAEALSGITHEDCASFAVDFGNVLDVEELVPETTEYTLEVSSPGVERNLRRQADYQRFLGMLVKVKLFEPVENTKLLTGRIVAAMGDIVALELPLPKSKGKKAAAEPKRVELNLRQIREANLTIEI